MEQIPKPRKFFKSRNAAPPAEIQQQMVMHHQSYQNHVPQDQHNQAMSCEEEEEVSPRSTKKKKTPVKKEKPVQTPKVEKPPKPEKLRKPKREKKVKVKEENPVPESAASEEDSPLRRGKTCVEPTRSSGRSRAKCVNYNEDAGEVEFYNRIDRRVAPKSATITSTDQARGQTSESETAPIEVPAPQQSPSLHPPIVLRISKVCANKEFSHYN